MTPYSTTIVDLGSQSLKLRFPLTVVLRQNGTRVIASWPEIQAWSTGDSDSDAVDGLKNEIAALYDELVEADDASLGELPLRWKFALQAAITEK